MRVRVKLPSGPLLEFWHFCNAIAEALCPLPGQAVGIDCVTGKQIARQLPLSPLADQRERWSPHMGVQRVLLSDNDQMLRAPPEMPDAEPPSDVASCREVVELPWISDLDDEDRRVLDALLPHLPALRSPIYASDEEAFLSAYRDMPGRPAWVPVLMTIADVKHRERLQGQYP